ncbi:MAG TPA: hypothetical protein VFC68_01910 [Treponemataceae bacterium]|nr:hypothetical protein [Treponemataceae bacterium]
MKLDPAIVIKDNQIYTAKNIPVSLRVFTFNDTLAMRKKLNSEDKGMSAFFEHIKNQGYNMLRWLVYWDIVEPVEDSFNEEYLAVLRDNIQKAKTAGLLVYLVPNAYSDSKNFWGINSYPVDKVIDGENAGQYLVGCFIDAMKHLARRIKDCESVIGFALSHFYYEIMKTEVSVKETCVFANNFMKALYKKHTHYYYIVEENEELKKILCEDEGAQKYKIISNALFL